MCLASTWYQWWRTSLSLLIAHVENEGGWEDCDLDIQYFQVEYRDHEY